MSGQAPVAGAAARPPEAAPPKYWAFISYSHADEAWARWLHRALESYSVPARLIGTTTRLGVVPRRLFPVFRDRDELAGAPELGPELRSALASSRAIVVVCSPSAARSRWVDDEIRYFKSLSPDARAFALIVDGEPNGGERECFPAALRLHVDTQGRLTQQPAEPIAADARPHADGRENARLKLIAGLLGVRYDDLRQRDLQARNRRLAIATALASGVAFSTAGLAVVAWKARDDAMRRQQQAEDLLQFMLGDLRDKLEPIGKLAILDAVGAKAMDYFSTLTPTDETDAALASRATALRQIGEVRIKQGNLDGAGAAFAESLRLSEALGARHPDDLGLLETVAKAQFWVGHALYLRGDADAAQPWMQRHLASVEGLQSREPGNASWTQKVIEARTNLGALEYARKDYPAAESAFARALAAQQSLVAQDEHGTPALETLAALHGWLSSVASAQGSAAAALGHARAGSEALRTASARAPDDARLRQRLAEANLRTLYAELKIRPIAPDSPLLVETLELTRSLVDLDPENLEYAHARVTALWRSAQAELAAGQLPRARDHAAVLLAEARDAFKRAPASAVALDDFLSGLTLAAQTAWLRHDSPGALAAVREALGLSLAPSLSESIDAGRWADLHLLAGVLAKDAAQRRASLEQAGTWLQRLRAAGEPPPDLMLRYEALRGDRAAAQQWSARLSGPLDPVVAGFCAAVGGCEAPKR